ncbi:N-acetylglucosamine-1-phosphodiester alpha-N-acetylglucosaminidase [Nematostella vectensis]|uniref:N-acetylglucosamine-1-phosphodiester alpha-N-acetylglucosaminidase n=1 Tax=Nematostella vectensis TaxID=45351 RepID=UPI00138FDC4B|nr:N-acetylglucosamine-1-phosphodiester alpha-N-acetylglucosaminidase [Nematostella vectensis]
MATTRRSLLFACQFTIVVYALFASVAPCYGESEVFLNDFLTPYHHSQRRSKRSLRYIRDCQPVQFGNVTHEEFPSSKVFPAGKPFVQIKNFFYEFEDGSRKADVQGHVSVVENPLNTFSILEPGEVGGCGKSVRSSVANSSRQKKCHVASNAGFFKTKNGNCLGNIVSNGKLVMDADGVQNANFGIRKDGTIVTGYLSENTVLDQENPFVQLVTGVIWLVRNGEVYVNASKKAECEDLQESGSVDLFVNVLAARTAIGHDAQGRVVIVQVDGKTLQRGMDLYSFAELLIKYGLVNAINLDGGGSTTMVVNGSVVNYPSDKCGDFICAREVSTIACFHAPDCDPLDCNGRGTCQMGECVCDHPWTGPGCDTHECRLTNCSMNGVCTKVGCQCNAGWTGEHCLQACPSGTFGVNCAQKCLCYNGGSCDVVSGTCTCRPGWMGRLCQLSCPPGRYGALCAKSCNCRDTCYCDSVSGLCPSHHATGSGHFASNQTEQWMACLESTREAPYNQAKEEAEEKYRILFPWFIVMACVCALCIIAISVLVYLVCKARKRGNGSHERYTLTSREEELT